MILAAIAAKLKGRSKDDFKGRHFEAGLIVQAVSWYLRYPSSYRDVEELLPKRGLEVDHSTVNRWVLAYAPLLERRLRPFRKAHCGSVRVDETYVRIRGEWRYLYRAIDKHGEAVDFLLTAKRDLDAAKRFFRKMLKDGPLLSPDRIGTDGAGTYPGAIAAARKDGRLARDPVHHVTKHLQQGIESDHFRLKKNMPRVGGFRSFNTARRSIQGFEAMLWTRKGFGFAGPWTVIEQNRMLGLCFGLSRVNEACSQDGPDPACNPLGRLRQTPPDEGAVSNRDRDARKTVILSDLRDETPITGREKTLVLVHYGDGGLDLAYLLGRWQLAQRWRFRSQHDHGDGSHGHGRPFVARCTFGVCRAGGLATAQRNPAMAKDRTRTGFSRGPMNTGHCAGKPTFPARAPRNDAHVREKRHVGQI